MKRINLITHDGKFHLDEVFGYSILNELFEYNNLIRTRDEKALKMYKEDNSNIFFDIGKVYNLDENFLDHHLISKELITIKPYFNEMNITEIRFDFMKNLISSNFLIFENMDRKFNFLNKELVPYLIKDTKKDTENLTLEEYYSDYLGKDVKYLENLLNCQLSVEKAKIIFVNRFDYSKLSSLGIIWNKYGIEYLKKYLKYENLENKNIFIEKLHEKIKNSIVKNIDRDDNGIEFMEKVDGLITLSEIVNLYNLENVKDEKQEEQFIKASEICKNYLNSFINGELTRTKDLELIKKEYIPGKRIQYFSKHFKGMDTFILENERKNKLKKITLFIVFPDGDNGFMLKTLKSSKYQSKKDLPKTWIENKPEGCYFIHPNLFIAGFEKIEYIKNIENQI